jgi:hypothetical protein
MPDKAWGETELLMPSSGEMADAPHEYTPFSGVILGADSERMGGFVQMYIGIDEPEKKFPEASRQPKGPPMPPIIYGSAQGLVRKISRRFERGSSLCAKTASNVPNIHRCRRVEYVAYCHEGRLPLVTI